MTIGKLQIEPEALILLALLYYLDNSGIALWVLLACMLHEFGHWGMIYAMGGRVRRIHLSGRGAELCLSAAFPLPPLGMCLAALAGPAVNLFLAVMSTFFARRGAGSNLYFFAGVNLGLAGFNLLPVNWLDGGRALEALLFWIGLGERNCDILTVCSRCIVFAILILGGILFWESGGKQFTLLLAGGWMALVCGQESN